jgi:hypothetical protein
MALLGSLVGVFTFCVRKKVIIVKRMGCVIAPNMRSLQRARDGVYAIVQLISYAFQCITSGLGWE